MVKKSSAKIEEYNELYAENELFSKCGELQKVLEPVPVKAGGPGAAGGGGGGPPTALPVTLESLLRTRPELCLGGLLALRQGYLLISLILSSLYHHIEERRFRVAAYKRRIPLSLALTHVWLRCDAARFSFACRAVAAFSISDMALWSLSLTWLTRWSR